MTIVLSHIKSTSSTSSCYDAYVLHLVRLNRVGKHRSVPIRSRVAKIGFRSDPDPGNLVREPDRGSRIAFLSNTGLNNLVHTKTWLKPECGGWTRQDHPTPSFCQTPKEQ